MTRVRRVEQRHSRTYDYPTVALPSRIGLTFERVPLADVSGEKSHAPHGLVLGPLAIHPLKRWPELTEPAGFRVSHRETGGAVADFDDLLLAVGFTECVKTLDWSGTLAEIIARNGAAVAAAYQEWNLGVPEEPAHA